MTVPAAERNAASAASQSAHSLAVHRCRFVDYNPASISAIAFPPLPLPTTQPSKFKRPANSGRRFGTLAVGRSNGNIELYEWSDAEHGPQATQAWVVSKILYGPNPSKVDSLVFVSKHPHLYSRDIIPSLPDLRLFSSGGGNELVEWDLVHGTVLRTLDSQGGAIWSMSVNPACTALALGCEDGCVRVLDLVGGELVHARRFDRVKSRLLSIAWGPPIPPAEFERRKKREDKGNEKEEDEESSDEDEDEWIDSWLVTGGSDSSLRKWDAKTGRVLERMTVDKVRGDRTLVWAVGVLADGTIISGDSLGVVKFWDPRTYTQMYSFQAHGADVLCLAISPDGNSVFTSGVDQKACHFMQVKISNADVTTKKALRQSYRWVHSTSKRMHSHDVRALAIWPPYLPIHTTASQRLAPLSISLSGPFAGISPILASGGLDASLALVPCASTSSTDQHIINPLQTSTVSTFEDAYHRRVAYPTGLAPAISVARSARLVACARETSLTIWRITGRPRSARLPGTFGYLKDLEAAAEAMDVDGNDGRGSEKVLANGGMGVEMAAVEAEADDENGYEKLLDMELDTTTNICASALSDDGLWLAVSDVYEVKLFELTPPSAKSGIRPRRVKSLMDALAPHFPRNVPTEGASALGFAPDSARLMIAGSLSARIYVVDLTGRADDSDRPVPRVLRRFEHHARHAAIFDVVAKGRVVRTMPASRINNPGTNGGVDANGEREKEEGDDSDHESADMSDVNENCKGASTEPEAGEEADELHALVTRMAFSSDGQWLATTDDQCRTHIFNLDAVQHHTTLPSSPSPVLALAFSSCTSGPSNQTVQPHYPQHSRAQLVLLLAHADSTLGVFDVEARRFAPWATHLAQRSTLPQRWTRLHDAVLGAAFEPPPSSSAVRNLNLNAHAELSTGSGTGGGSQIDSSFSLSLGSAFDTGLEANGRRVASEGREERGQGGSTAVLLWGSTWLCRVVLDAPVGWGGFMKKRHRREEGPGAFGMGAHNAKTKTKHNAKNKSKLKREKSKDKKKGKAKVNDTSIANRQKSTAGSSANAAAVNRVVAADCHELHHARAQQASSATAPMEETEVAAADADITVIEEDTLRQTEAIAEIEASAPSDAEPEPEHDADANADIDPSTSEQLTTNFKLVTRYRPILFADFLSARELLVVERPLVDVLRTLPPAFFKPRYGS